TTEPAGRRRASAARRRCGSGRRASEQDPGRHPKKPNTAWKKSPCQGASRRKDQGGSRLRVEIYSGAMTLITDSAALARFCLEQKGAGFVAVDTEFMRERTYWPVLCLVQVAGPKCAAVIDALAPEIDLAPLLALMAEPNVLKVFHAARQDIE